MATLTSTRQSTDTSKPRPTSAKRKKDQRSDIWGSLLRQTRQAQARSRTSILQHRDLLVLGGSPEDQRNFVERYVARPPPASAGRNQGQQQQQQQQGGKRKGEVRLSNRFAYGYGHVTLFTPPAQQGIGGGGGAGGLLGGEAEEAARVECHCFAGDAEAGYEETLRRLLQPRRDTEKAEGEEEHAGFVEQGGEERRPSVCILLSWHEPWNFLSTLQRWLTLLARSLLPAQSPKDENPAEVLKEHALGLTLVLQHVEAQEGLERENYKDDDFDYISQVLRTCLLPLSGALVCTPTSPPPQQAGSPLTDVQKMLYNSLGLDVAALQPRTGRPGSSDASGQTPAKKEDWTTPKHNVVDRMAIVVPSGWDSLGKIRLLSETFSPEAVTEGWMADLERAAATFIPKPAPSAPAEESEQGEQEAQDGESGTLQATGGAETYSSQHSPPAETLDEPPMSPSKQPKSAIGSYENTITDPQAHKAPRPAQLEVTTRPDQEFLGELRTQLQQFEAEDSERQRREGIQPSTTAGALQARNSAGGAGDAGSGALNDLGEVSFNVGGVSYNTVTAEAAIEKLKRPSAADTGTSSSAVGTPRTGTPRPPKREAREDSASTGTPGTGAKGELQTDKLEEYFASLMKRGGSSSASSTPSKPPQ